MSVAAHEYAESGMLAGRYEWVVEATPMAVPVDPAWSLFSDNLRQWTFDAGAQVERVEGMGTPDATDHGRANEDPSGTVAYDMQRFPVDGAGNPVSAEAYAGLRDEQNRIHSTLLCVGRTEDIGGNFDAGIRTYTVARGVAFSTVTANLDPSSTQPILLENEVAPRKVRSYIIHQPDGTYAVQATSTEPAADSGLSITVEDEGAVNSATVAVDGATESAAIFADVDAIWIDGEPEGDITVEYTDGAGTVEGVAMDGVSEETTDASMAGGLTYSDDDQPVDGDRGVPLLGSGSHASDIGTTFEYFLGDRLERAAGTSYRPRINSASWSVENSVQTEAMHHTRAPTNDLGNRNVTVEADIAGPRASHDSMMDSLQKTSFPIYHQLSGGVVEFPSMVLIESGERNYEAEDQAVAAISETLEMTGGGVITFHQGDDIETVTA